jgi:hypothetical protein
LRRLRLGRPADRRAPDRPRHADKSFEARASSCTLRRIAGTAFGRPASPADDRSSSGTAGGDSNLMMLKSDGKFETASVSGRDPPTWPAAVRFHEAPLDSTGRIVAPLRHAQRQVIQARFENVATVVEVRDLLTTMLPRDPLTGRDTGQARRRVQLSDARLPRHQRPNRHRRRGLTPVPPLRRLPRISIPAVVGSSGSLVPCSGTDSGTSLTSPPAQDFVVAEIFAKADGQPEGDESFDGGRLPMRAISSALETRTRDDSDSSTTPVSFQTGELSARPDSPTLPPADERTIFSQLRI